MIRRGFEWFLQQQQMSVVFQTHRHVLDGFTRIEPDLQTFARIHHLQLQFGLYIIQRAGDSA